METEDLPFSHYLDMSPSRSWCMDRENLRQQKFVIVFLLVLVCSFGQAYRLPNETPQTANSYVLSPSVMESELESDELGGNYYYLLFNYSFYKF